MSEKLDIRHPRLEDGSALWRLVKASSLATNSPYMYLLLCDHFSRTCCVVELDGQLVGFVVGLMLPDKPDTLFVWQVGIESSLRGKGMARQLLHWLVERNWEAVRFLEATVGESNLASQALFRSIARAHRAPCAESVYLKPEHYPVPDVEPDLLFRIGPLEPHWNT